MVIGFKGNWEEILKYIKTTATPNIIAAFDDMVKQANAKLTGIGLPALSIPASAIPGKRQKQTGGMITETGIHLLHAGEQVIPRSQVEAGKGIKGNISVNFYGGMTLTKEADEDRLANKIRNVMMQDQHLAQSGLY